MTAAETHYRAHRQRLDQLEPLYAPKLRRALLRSVERALAAAEAGASPALAAGFVDPAPVRAALQQLYVAAGAPEAAITYDQLTAGRKALAPPAVLSRWAQRLRSFISQEGAAAVKGITDTTRRLVRAVLHESAAAGHGAAEAARNLRARVEELAPARAVKIVRTELLSAGNYGSLLGAEATGLQLDKCWLATPGSRTRPEHQAANGQCAPLQGGFFSVGGEPGRYPGDPLLSAGMRCNCRCSIIYKEKQTAKEKTT